MASRRAALAPLSDFSGSEEFWVDSSSLQSGQRLANPGLPGLSSNSSPQTTQVLIGYGMLFYFSACALKDLSLPRADLPRALSR